MAKITKKTDDLMILRAMDKGQFVRVNASFTARTGFDAAELAEKPFLDWIVPDDRASVQAALDKHEKSFVARHVTQDGNPLPLRIQVSEHGEGIYVLGRCASVPAQPASDQPRPADTTMAGTLATIARIIEEQNPGFKCSILLVEDGRFVSGAGPSLPDDYNAAVNGYAIGPTVGSCGTAIYWNTPVIVEDIQADPLWVELAALAKKAGVAACWSHPFISSNGKVLGALAFHAPAPCAPTAEQFGQLKAAARITGLAVERGRAEEALKHANAAAQAARKRLQATLNAMPDLLFEVDAAGHIFDYHSHRDDLLAAPPEVFMGKRFADVLPPDAAEAGQRAIDGAAQHGFSYGERYRLVLPQGERWFELSATHLQTDDASGPRFVIISRDITERKRDVAALEASEEAQRSLIAALPDVIMRFDSQGRHLFVSDNVKEVAGLPATAFPGKTHQELGFPEAVCKFWEQAIRQPFLTGQPYDTEFELDGPAGHVVFNWRLTPDIGADGKVNTVLAVARDITEERRREQALKESEKRFRTLFEGTPSISVQGYDAKRRVIYWNHASENLYGYSQDEALGRQLEDLIIPDGMRQGVIAAVSAWVAGGPAVPAAELVLRHKNGTDVPVFSSHIMQPGPNGPEMYCIDIDLTEQKRAAAALDRQVRYNEMMRELSVALINLPLDRLDDAVNAALAQVGEFFCADRAYVFDYDLAGGTTSNTFEWCAPGIDPQIDALQQVPTHAIPEWCEVHRRGEAMLIPSLQALPPGPLRQLLEPQGIHSLLSVPVMAGGELQGFVGLDAVRQATEFGVAEIELLRLFAELLANLSDRKQTEAVLETEHTHLRTLVNTIPDLVWLKDAEGIYLACNPEFERFFGASERDILGKTDYDFMPRELADFFREHERKAIAAGKPSHNEEWITYASDCRRVLLDTTRTPMRMADGRLIGVLGIGHDITAMRQTEQSLKEREQYQRALLDNFPFMVWLKDTESRFLAVNQAFADTAGVASTENLIGKTDIDIFPIEDAVRYRADDREVLDSGTSKIVEEPIVSNGRVTWAETYKSAVVLDGKTIGTVGFARDITERRQYQQQLEHIAHYDSLTDLPNRVLLADRLHQAMLHAQRHDRLIVVAYIDLDGFKAINDQYGHDTGDQLLTNLADHMKRALREGDTLARLGGDEFVAILGDLTNVESTAPLLTRLLAAASEVFLKDGQALRVTASLGITFYPQAEPVDADQLLRQADQAMYQAKLTGKNRYHIFDVEQDRSVRGHHESLERIRQALDEREFVLYYQPKVNMRTGDVIGVEALIRWQHPARGMLPPGDFLPLIANHSIAIELGEWVLETAMTQIENWKAASLSLPISVNIDAIQLQHSDFVERLRARMEAHPGLAAGDLELEVLETSALVDFVHVTEVIRACAEMGVGFALDDFGTGYSSLTYLKRLPASLLKIDRSFVRDMLDDPDNLAILQGVLGLATAFQRRAIAEGVENIEHGQMLLQLGCELGQGYAIARPMPAEEIPACLAHWQPDASWCSQTPIRRDDLPILFASVEHRVWIRDVARYIVGEAATLPPMHHEECRLGQWLYSEALVREDNAEALKALVPLHIEIHSLASELISLKLDGQVKLATSRLSELYQLRDRLLAELLETLR